MLNVMLISGKKLQSFKVDEHTKFTEIYDGIPKANYMSVKLLAKTKILPEKDVTFREFKLVGVTELTAVFSHKNKFCPRCRSFQRARHNPDKFARLMWHDYENNPTHHIGLQFPNRNVAANVSSFDDSRTYGENDKKSVSPGGTHDKYGENHQKS